MAYLKLAGGTVYDPANGIDGEVRDLWVRDGKMVPAPSDSDKADVRVTNLSGLVVMPGGVDMHCHIAGPKVNSARKMQPELIRRQHETGAQLPMDCIVPDIYTTGFRYTGLGYTTCFDAAISPLASRHVHREFEQIPNVDCGFFVLMGNNHYAMERIAQGDHEGLKAILGWMLNKTGAYAPKLVNPGGVELWKQRIDGNAKDLDQVIDGFDVTPRQIIQAVTRASNELELPHPVHIHTNNLGMPGNWTTTAETLKAVQGMRAHLTHIQFHSYGGGDAEADSICSRVAPLADWVNSNPLTTVDVGQVMFGSTTSMTGDGPLGHFLHQISGKKWYSADTELESGCGISPIEYKNKNFVHALQWAIGLEWYLLVHDPWQVVMSTDHPNGGSFLAYPQIIRLLMDSSYRREILATVSPKVLKHSQLADLDREYSLNEVAIITRAGPARILGLKNKGHLGEGADADITVYTPSRDYAEMFALPRMVFKGGRLLVEDSEVRRESIGNTLSANPNYDESRKPQIEAWFDDHYSLKAKNFGV